MERSLSPETLALLRCPETGATLHVASEEELTRFDTPLPGGALVTEDGGIAYPIEEGFPMLLAGQALRRSEP